ncbi:metal ABC transporter ATP-binding protein [Desulfopila inferna]|uniref:metal ABC transporter ATP-binding protein n=1 Tax=Desulfopila inferna TaxID=468528 RepID=UPI0019658B5B|nr:ABC transporter ATP-binding protein [Desulfopila inferna]MBM9604009.1 ABC transporter ATP-binding protein [Desulfopila inferna]
MAAPIIEIDDLCFSYSGTEVLHNINLTVFERDFVAVIGPNGGGKTTLLKLILGLLKPSWGSIKLSGRPLGSGRTTIGYVPQQIDHNLSFPATALDIVLMGLHTPKRRLFFRHSPSDREDALDALEQMGISTLADAKITDLSGGQRQRILIARALVTKPDLLVLDEPTASIDTKGQADFYELLSSLNRRLTIFMASHDLLTISSYAKSIACVNKRLHYHRSFETSSELLSAFYSCSVDESCPVEAVSQKIAMQQEKSGGIND